MLRLNQFLRVDLVVSPAFQNMPRKSDITRLHHIALICFL
jgi:hypothetical protein